MSEDERRAFLEGRAREEAEKAAAVAAAAEEEAKARAEEAASDRVRTTFGQTGVLLVLPLPQADRAGLNTVFRGT